MTAERRPAPWAGKNSRNTSSGASNSVAREYTKDGNSDPEVGQRKNRVHKKDENRFFIAI
jgi:hypothetical protein